MSTNPRWRRAPASRPLSNPSKHQNKPPGSTTLLRTPPDADQTSVSSAPLPEEQKLPSEKLLYQVRIPISTSYPKLHTLAKRNDEEDLSTRCTNISTSELQLLQNQPVRTDPHRTAGHTLHRRPLQCTSRLSNTPSTSTLSKLSIASGQSLPATKNTLFIQKKNDGHQQSMKLDRLRQITELPVPHHRFDHRRENERAPPSITVSNGIVTHKESIRSSCSSQRNFATGILNRKQSYSLPVPNPKKLTPSTKLKRSKTNVMVRTSHKPDTRKLGIAFPAKVRKRHKRRKSRMGKSKNSSSSESSEALELSERNSDVAGVKLVAAGQHGFMKNASTGSESVEASFTIVNVDAFPKDSDQNQTEKTTRAVGTSIQDEFVSKRGVHFPHPAHRSVCMQADGSDKGPCDTKTLFQKLLPRINSLATKRKQPSLNPSSSGQSSYSGFWSNSTSYHGSQSVHSTSERVATSVDIQYVPSGNVKAVLRVSSTSHSKYSNRSSTIWSNDRLTPIIQGVSLTPTRTPSTQQTQTLSKNSSSITSRRYGPTKKCS